MFKIYLVPVAILNSSSSEMLTLQSMCVCVSVLWSVCLSVCWYISHRADVHYICSAVQSYWLVHSVYLPIGFHPQLYNYSVWMNLGTK